MKNEFDKLLKRAHMIAMTNLLLREKLIDTGTYNTMIYKIKHLNSTSQ